MSKSLDFVPAFRYTVYMFIRKTTIKNKKNAEPYYTFRLVESVRTQKGVRQHTLLNLGKNFHHPKENWPDLARRIEDILYGQKSFIPINPELEETAQHCAALIIQARGVVKDEQTSDYRCVDVDSLRMTRPRSVGTEHLALSIAKQLHLEEQLENIGFTKPQIAAAVGVIIGRMAKPGSELATHEWLRNRSGLGELLDYDYQKLPLKKLYQASDQLLKHKDALEKHLYEKQSSLFALEKTITLYDLTNTYFEGGGKSNELAAHGRSKEKRSDCPLVTLAIVLDGSGFPIRSEVFAGNVSEPKTLSQMIKTLESSASTANHLSHQSKPAVVMDAGIATEDNIEWLKEQGYKYLVVSRKRKREFCEEEAVLVKEDRDGTVKVQKVIDEKSGETLLYCHSSKREKKEAAIKNLFSTRFEQALQKLTDGLAKKGCLKKYDKVLERIGALKQRYSKAAKHYRIIVNKDDKSGNASSITWTRKEAENTTDSLSGVYCLRTNLDSWNESALWHTYTMLTELEAVFCSLKSELGLRPVFHQVTNRVSGHLFISLLAYHLAHTIRFQLKQKGINDSWAKLRDRLIGQERITVSMRSKNGEMVHVRKTTHPEPRQMEIYAALNISPNPGRTVKKTM